jgi:phosphatidylglycerophosphate synthase
MIDTAIMVCPRDGLPEAALLDVEVAGLNLLTRGLLTAQQAGFRKLVVVASPGRLDALRRQAAIQPRLDGCVRWAEGVSDLPKEPARCVVWVPMVVLHADALRAWQQRASEVDGIATAEGVCAGPWAIPSALFPAFVDAAREGLAGLERFREHARRGAPVYDVPWKGTMPETVRSSADVPGVERRMLRALRTPEDGPIVDRFVNRTISEWISRRLVRWPVTPNQTTIASLLTGLLGAWVLRYDGAATSLLGLALFQCSVVLDHVDGEIARLRFQFSRLGKWLDNFSDHVVDLAVIAAIAWRVAVGGSGASVLALLGAAVLGVTGSFLVVFFWSLRGGRNASGKPSQRAAAAMISMSNRDGFCLALWATILLGRPVWFLWTLAIGSNIYWMAWLAVCGLPRRARASAG